MLEHSTPGCWTLALLLFSEALCFPGFPWQVRVKQSMFALDYELPTSCALQELLHRQELSKVIGHRPALLPVGSRAHLLATLVLANSLSPIAVPAVVSQWLPQ